MTKEEKLTLDEFVTAPRKPVMPSSAAMKIDGVRADDAAEVALAGMRQEPEPHGQNDVDSAEARRALRRLKRDRLKGVESFVNVRLDRETKQRLRYAAFKSELPMQSIMVSAIKRYLDENDY